MFTRMLSKSNRIGRKTIPLTCRREFHFSFFINSGCLMFRKILENHLGNKPQFLLLWQGLVLFRNTVFERENQQGYVRIVVYARFPFSTANFDRNLSNDQHVVSRLVDIQFHHRVIPEPRQKKKKPITIRLN